VCRQRLRLGVAVVGHCHQHRRKVGGGPEPRLRCARHISRQPDLFAPGREARRRGATLHLRAPSGFQAAAAARQMRQCHRHISGAGRAQAAVRAAHHIHPPPAGPPLTTSPASRPTTSGPDSSGGPWVSSRSGMPVTSTAGNGGAPAAAALPHGRRSGRARRRARRQLLGSFHEVAQQLLHLLQCG
jgi:hypothetical protein